MDLEAADSLKHVSVVHLDSLIIGAGEEQITIVVELNFEDRSRMTGQVNWLHSRHFLFIVFLII